jgi:hypothetical protein
MTARHFIKIAGGKAKLVPFIKEMIQPRYTEPNF